MIAAYVALAALLLIIAGQWWVILTKDRDHGRERDAWASERWQIMTRIQAPEVARSGVLPPPLPSQRPAEPLPEPTDEVPDEVDAVGTVVA